MRFIGGLLLLSMVHAGVMIWFPGETWVHLGVWGVIVAGVVMGALRFDGGRRGVGGIMRRMFPWHFWVVIGVAVALRLPLLEIAPANIGGDEMSQAIAAAEFASGENRDVFGLNGWYSTPNFYYAITGMVLRVLGVSVWGWRVASVIFGVMTVGLTYFWARLIGGWRLGFLAGLVLAGSHFHIHFSRIGAHQITDAFWAAAVMGSLFLATERKRLGLLIVSGLGAGIGMNFYFGARIIPLIVGFSLVSMAVGRGWGWLFRALLLFGVGFWIGWYPFALTQLSDPGRFQDRVNQVVVDEPWTFERVARRVGIAARVVVLPGLTQWYVPNSGIVSKVAFGWLVVGIILVWRLEKGRKKRSVREIFWRRGVPLLLVAGLPLLTVALLADYPVASQRVVMIMPAVAILIGWGIWGGLGLLTRGRWQWRLAMAAMVMVMVVDGWIYFIQYTPERRYGEGNTLVATEMGRLGKAPDGTTIVLYGLPRMWYHSFANHKFLMPHLEGVDVELEDEVEARSNAVYVALPERVADLARLAASDGRREMVSVFWFERPENVRERLVFYGDKERGVRMGEVYTLGDGVRVEKGEVLFFVYDPEKLVGF